ncbi:tetratricopeptide repeat protein [Leptolyngbyaceae cyanobacterium UHCC 1019]
MTHEPIALAELTAQGLPDLRFDASGELVRQIAAAATFSPNRKLSLRQLANIKATLYWLQDYQPLKQATHLDQVRGWLEAFHHLSQLAAWQAAEDLLSMPVPASQPPKPDQSGRSLPLHEQLEVWGYYQELTDLYAKLLGKRDDASDQVCCDRLGTMHRFRGRLPEATDYHQRSLQLAEQLDDSIAKARALLGLADVNFRLDQFENGIIQAQTALTLARQQHDRRLLADCLGCLSNGHSDDYFACYKPKLALSYAQEGLQLAQQLDDAALQCRLLNHMGGVYFSLGKASEAIAHHQQGLALAEATDNLRYQWANLHNLGLVHFQLLQDQKQGEALFLASIQIARQMQNLSCETQTHLNQAFFNQQQGKSLTVQSNLQQILELAQRSGDAYQEWQSQRNLGVILLRQKQFEQARLHWDRAEELARSHHFRFASLRAADTCNTSYLLSSLGDWRKGLRYGKQGLAIARRCNNKQEQSWAIMVIAYAYWQGNQRLWALLIFLRHLPQAAQLALRDESLRYTLLTGLQVITSPLLTAIQRLGRFLQLQPRNQEPR